MWWPMAVPDHLNLFFIIYILTVHSCVSYDWIFARCITVPLCAVWPYLCVRYGCAFMWCRANFCVAYNRNFVALCRMNVLCRPYETFFASYMSYMPLPLRVVSSRPVYICPQWRRLSSICWLSPPGRRRGTRCRRRRNRTRTGSLYTALSSWCCPSHRKTPARQYPLPPAQWGNIRSRTAWTSGSRLAGKACFRWGRRWGKWFRRSCWRSSASSWPRPLRLSCRPWPLTLSRFGRPPLWTPSCWWCPPLLTLWCWCRSCFSATKM